jgi:hypothetical protein
VEMQTQIALMLTTMPTTTPEQVSAPTATLPPVVTASEPQPTSIPTATTVPEAPTPTPLPPTPTELPTQTAPTLTATPAGPTPTISPDDPRNRLGSPSDTDPMDDSTDGTGPQEAANSLPLSFGMDR